MNYEIGDNVVVNAFNKNRHAVVLKVNKKKVVAAMMIPSTGKIAVFTREPIVGAKAGMPTAPTLAQGMRAWHRKQIDQADTKLANVSQVPWEIQKAKPTAEAAATIQKAADKLRKLEAKLQTGVELPATGKYLQGELNRIERQANYQREAIEEVENGHPNARYRWQVERYGVEKTLEELRTGLAREEGRANYANAVLNALG